MRESSPSRELDPRVRLRRLLVAEGAPRKAARPHGCSRLGLLCRFAFSRPRVSYVRASSASREQWPRVRRRRLLVARGRSRTASGSQESLPGRPGESSGRPGKASRWSAKRLRMEPVSRADDYRNFSINCNYNHRTRTCLPRRDVSRGPCCRATL